MTNARYRPTSPGRDDSHYSEHNDPAAQRSWREADWPLQLPVAADKLNAKDVEGGCLRGSRLAKEQVLQTASWGPLRRPGLQACSMTRRAALAALFAALVTVVSSGSAKAQEPILFA